MKKLYDTVKILIMPLFDEDVLTTSSNLDNGTDVEGGWHDDWTQPGN